MLPIHFAPLQGYTEDIYRRLHHTICGGVECYYTPFLRIEHGKVRSKDLRDIRPEFNVGVPVVMQAIASSGEELKSLIAIAEQNGYSRIDLNMGCPFPLQTRHGRGAGILTNPAAVGELCEVVKSHPDLSFSVKMRLGLDDHNDWRQLLPLLNDTPLTHITLHPRTGSQQYKGEVDMQSFADFLSESIHPIIYNGDITSVEQIHQLEADFSDFLQPQADDACSSTHHAGLAGVMIGRGLLARPTLALEYQQGAALSDRDVIAKILAMHTQLLANYEQIIPGESQRLNKIRTFWDYMEPTLGRKAWKKIMKAGNMKNYLLAVAELA